MRQLSGIKVALYARYSSDQQRESSIEDQFRNCEQRAKREGWTIVSRYKDQAQSGATEHRAGYQAMLSAAKKKEFDVLLVDDLSRLSRDRAEAIRVRERFKFWRVRLVGVSDGIDTENELSETVADVRGFINASFLKELRDKTHRGLAGQALKGNNCGGRTFGYRHVRIKHATDTDAFGEARIVGVRREIDPEQAKIVRTVFEWFAEGRSPKWIAAELNHQHIKSPRGGTWCASAIYGDPQEGTGFLSNPLYVGRYIWNRSMWERNPDTKKRRRTLRPETDWVTTEVPGLRIISGELWDRVQVRLRDQHEKSATIRAALGRKFDRRGQGSKFLFSGLLKCGQCGANYIIAFTDRYACAGYLNRGTSVCSNKLRVSRQMVESRLLAGLKDELFTPEAIDLFVKEKLRLRRERAKAQDLQESKQRLGEVEKEIANLVRCVRMGGDFSSTLLDTLREAERERDNLQKTVQQGAPPAVSISMLVPRTKERFAALLRNMEEVLQLPSPSSAHRIESARMQLKTLLGGPVKLYPAPQGQGLDADLGGDYSALLQMAVGERKMTRFATPRNQLLRTSAKVEADPTSNVLNSSRLALIVMLRDLHFHVFISHAVNPLREFKQKSRQLCHRIVCCGSLRTVH